MISFPPFFLSVFFFFNLLALLCLSLPVPVFHDWDNSILMLVVPRERPIYSWLNLPDLRHLGGCYWSGQRTNITTTLHPQNSLGVQDYWCPLVDAISIYNLHRQLWFNAKNQVSLYIAFVWMCMYDSLFIMCMFMCVWKSFLKEKRFIFLTNKCM